MITSSSNANIKYVINLQKKAKARKQEQCFVVEGVRMTLEAPVDLVKVVYVSTSFKEKNRKEYEQVQQVFGRKKVLVEEVTDSIMESMSDTKTPQGILAVVAMPQYGLVDILEGRDNPLVIVLDDLQDPGNLGTILRTGEGAGISGVVMSKNTVDIYNPKVIRSTMGSLYRVPFVYVEDLVTALAQMHSLKFRSYAMHLQGEKYYDAMDFTGPTAILIGNEGNGLSDAVANAASEYVKIPMEGQVESLNAAVSAAIMMYEVSRQRRSK
ncbi:MAG: RNA methyltransferase [Lachnospiraceae bacterium]|nr:RNA methyltransferase [Lachnospiraceae bacterium]